MDKAKASHFCFVIAIIMAIVCLLCAILVPIAADFGMKKEIDAKVLLKE